MSKILVVVDMQKDFVTGTLGTKEAQDIRSNMVEKINEYKNRNENIYITLDTHKEDYLKTQEGINLPVKHCIRDSDGWKLDEIIENEIYKNNYKNTKIFEKPSFGSFDLAQSIKEIVDKDKNVKEVELVGVCTDICVISNAVIIKTAVPEIKITVDASCCAGVSIQKHNSTLEVMKSLQINVINE